MIWRTWVACASVKMIFWAFKRFRKSSWWVGGGSQIPAWCILLQTRKKGYYCAWAAAAWSCTHACSIRISCWRCLKIVINEGNFVLFIASIFWLTRLDKLSFKPYQTKNTHFLHHPSAFLPKLLNMYAQLNKFICRRVLFKIELIFVTGDSAIWAHIQICYCVQIFVQKLLSKFVSK